MQLQFLCADNEVKDLTKELAKQYTKLDMPEIITMSRAKKNRLNIFTGHVRTTSQFQADFRETYVTWFNVMLEQLENKGGLTGKSKREKRRLVERKLAELGSQCWDLKEKKSIIQLLR